LILDGAPTAAEPTNSAFRALWLTYLLTYLQPLQPVAMFNIFASYVMLFL